MDSDWTISSRSSSPCWGVKSVKPSSHRSFPLAQPQERSFSAARVSRSLGSRAVWAVRASYSPKINPRSRSLSPSGPGASSPARISSSGDTQQLFSSSAVASRAVRNEGRLEGRLYTVSLGEAFCTARYISSSRPPGSSSSTPSPPAIWKMRLDRRLKDSTSAYRLAWGPPAVHRARSVSWDCCSGTSSTWGRSRPARHIRSSTAVVLPDPARPNSSLNMGAPPFQCYCGS